MPDLVFGFLAADGEPEWRTVPITDLVLAGWTGRDPRKVEHHIAELAALGVAPPPATPCFYHAGADRLTGAATIDCVGEQSSGEAEYCLYVDEREEWWVGAASDHTDRHVETYSITVSKQMCPKPVASLLWRFADVADHWDALEIRSWIMEDGAEVAYQSGTIDAMLDPRDTVDALHRQGGALRPGTMMLGGTLPAIGAIRPARAFAFALRDPVRGRAITHRYETRWLPLTG